MSGCGHCFDWDLLSVESGKQIASPELTRGTLTASKSGDTIVLTDEKGGTARVTIGDVQQSNGVIHVIDTVLMPK